MKKLLLILAISGMSFTSFSQVVRVGTGLGFGAGSKRLGLNVNVIEVGYGINPAIETGAYFGLVANARRKFISAAASLDRRYGVQGKYYFKPTPGFKPYAGLQAGLLKGYVGELNIIGNDNGLRKATRFQLSPMVGFRTGPLNVNVALQQGLKLNVGLLFGFGDFK